MITNIVAYLTETTNMTQTDIASKLKNSDDNKTGVSQALVSKWNRGEKIPRNHERELLMMADLYWELELEDDEIPFGNLVESKWNIIVKSEKNQEDWYNFFTDMLAPKKFSNKHSEYKDSDFVKFVRECIFSLNEAGFVVPENPESISNKNNSRFFNLLRRWMHRVTILQYWCYGSIPHSPMKDSRYTELYDNLPRIALAQVIIKKDLPEKSDRALFENYVQDMTQFVDSLIRNYLFWDSMNEGFFGDDDFNELLIQRNKESKDTLTYSSPEDMTTEIENIHDQFLSYAERKIMDRLNANEKLIQELHQKIDLLINQNDDSDGIPF